MKCCLFVYIPLELSKIESNLKGRKSDWGRCVVGDDDGGDLYILLLLIMMMMMNCVGMCIPAAYFNFQYIVCVAQFFFLFANINTAYFFYAHAQFSHENTHKFFTVFFFFCHETISIFYELVGICPPFRDDLIFHTL